MNSYSTLMPQIVLDAGMGEVSRMGIFLNPFLGCNCKYAAVLTNLELETDGYVDFGLQKYCGKCTICADQCPSESIAVVPRHSTTATTRGSSIRAPAPTSTSSTERVRVRALHQGVPVEPPRHGTPRLRHWDGNLEWL
jgi:ferredoxin